MGFFRRHKLNHCDADACREHCDSLRTKLMKSGGYMAPEVYEELMIEWACYRELLARHEDMNESPLDERRQD